jgi:hypothetical protein
MSNICGEKMVSTELDSPGHARAIVSSPRSECSEGLRFYPARVQRWSYKRIYAQRERGANAYSLIEVNRSHSTAILEAIWKRIGEKRKGRQELTSTVFNLWVGGRISAEVRQKILDGMIETLISLKEGKEPKNEILRSPIEHPGLRQVY